jgi:hypothetical protein
MVYCLLVTGKFKFLAAVLAPEMFRIAYCAVVDPMFVTELVPAVFASVTSAVVIARARPPATAISK